MACVDSRRVILAQTIPLAAQTLDTSRPQTYRVALRYKATNIDVPTPVRVHFFVHETGGGDTQIDYGTQPLATLPAGDTDWTLAATEFQLDPALNTAPSYDGIKIRIETANQFGGELGFDTISVQAVGQPVELVENGSFTRGFEQVATGDHAAAFLNRLNGAAFWGSVSHHGSGGCAFCFNAMEQLVYFMRGLPLGDAVWFDDILNSGILYGDPLYSPVAVRLNPVNAADTVSGLVELHGSTVNGRDPARVSTTYAIDYCAGADFFVCDQAATWQSTGIRGQGGAADAVLGTWDTTGVSPGQYTLRLAVTSTHTVNSKTQSFYDYYPVTVQAPAADSNGDGLSDAVAIALGLDPNDPDGDTDNDGVADLVEIGAAINNPLDSDVDGVIDALEPGAAANDASTASGLALGGGVSLTLTSPGESLSDVRAVVVTGGPAGVSFPFGAVSYTTTSVVVGGDVSVQMLVSADLPANLALYKVDSAGQFTLLPTAVWTRIDARTLEITVTDGDPLTDGDGVANGLIADPIAPAAMPGGVNNVVSSSGGGGGCVLQRSSVHMDPTLLLLTLISLGALLRRHLVTIHR